MKTHLSPESVQRLVEGLHPQVRRMLEHLMGCSQCRNLLVEHTGSAAGGGAPNVLPWPTVAASNAEAETPLRMIDSPLPSCGGTATDELGVESWLADAGAGPLEGWALAERLLEASRQVRQDHPAKAERLALAAGRVAELLGTESAGGALSADLQTLAWTYVGAARRNAGDLRGCDEALRSAEDLLRRGSGDLLEKALVLGSLGILRKDQRRLDEAEELIRKSEGLYRCLGDREAANRALMNLADVFRENDFIDKAISTLEKVARELGDQRDSYFGMAVSHNLALNLTAASRYEEAEALLLGSAPLYEAFAEESTQIRRLWLIAKILRGKGLAEEAERSFLEVREKFIKASVGYDAAMVSLELATLYAEQGRFTEMRRLADEMLPIFRAHDIHREALAALAIFQQAARMEKVTLKLARDIAAYLDRARSQPDLRFELAAH